MKTREEEICAIRNEYMSDKELVVNFEENNKAAGYAEGFLDAAQWADEHPKNPWRDAKTSKPKRTGVCDDDDWTSDAVYVMMENGYTSSAYYDHLGGDWRDYGNGYRIKEPTYWMPIPETPKGGEQ